MKLCSRGFSFVEMMVVLAIIGIFLTFSARKLVTPNAQMKSEVRRFSAMIKRLRQRARIESRTFRLVFDLPPSNVKKDQSYWVESTDKSALLLNDEQREEMESELEADDKGVMPDPQGFKPDNTVVKEAPAYLPRGLYFDSVEINGEEIKTFTTGRIYIYFFPQGYVQGSAIHLTNKEELYWTLGIQPLTGQVNIYNTKRDLEDLLDQ